MATKKKTAPFNRNSLTDVNRFLAESAETLVNLTQRLGDLKAQFQLQDGNNPGQAQKTKRQIAQVEVEIKKFNAQRKSATFHQERRQRLRDRIMQRDVDSHEKLIRGANKLADDAARDLDQLSKKTERDNKDLLAAIDLSLKSDKELREWMTSLSEDNWEEFLALRDKGRIEMAARARKAMMSQRKTKKAAFTDTGTTLARNMKRLSSNTSFSQGSGAAKISDVGEADVIEKVLEIGEKVKQKTAAGTKVAKNTKVGQLVSVKVQPTHNTEFFARLKDINIGIGDRLNGVMDILEQIRDNDQDNAQKLRRAESRKAQTDRFANLATKEKKEKKEKDDEPGGIAKFLLGGIKLAGILLTLKQLAGIVPNTLNSVKRAVLTAKGLYARMTGNTEEFNRVSQELQMMEGAPGLTDVKGSTWAKIAGGAALMFPGTAFRAARFVAGKTVMPYARASVKAARQVGGYAARRGMAGLLGGAGKIASSVGGKLAGRAGAGILGRLGGGALARLGAGFLTRQAVSMTAGNVVPGLGPIVLTIGNILMTVGMLAWELMSDQLKDKIKTGVKKLFMVMTAPMRMAFTWVWDKMKEVFSSFMKWMDEKTGGLLGRVFPSIHSGEQPTGSGYSTTEGGRQVYFNDGSADALSFDQVNKPAVPLSGSKGDYYNGMYATLLDSAKRQGVQNPEAIARLGAAQASLETMYGRHAPNNNHFGIKGKGGTQTTREFINGQWVTTQDSFRGYKSPQESADDYIRFLKENPRYRNVLAAGSASEAIRAQGMTGYATDPAYASKLMSIHSKGGAGATGAAAPPKPVTPLPAAGAAHTPGNGVNAQPAAPPAGPTGVAPNASASTGKYAGPSINDGGTKIDDMQLLVANMHREWA